MSHLFKKAEYIDFRGKYYAQIKKVLEQRIQYAAENQIESLHPIEGLEETVIDQSQFNLVYQGETIVLPKRLLEIDDFSTILNMDTINSNFTPEEIDELKALTPNGTID